MSDVQCPWCKGTSNHAVGFDCRTTLQLDPLTVLRIATTKEFQRINDELRQMRKELDALKKGKP